MSRKIFFSSLVILLVLAGVLLGIGLQQQSQALKVVFLDVGQGDAILLSQGAEQVLIDGGRDGKLLLNQLGKFMPFWDRQIENVVLTHPDQDHLAGLIAVLDTYQVPTIFESEAANDSQTFKVWQERERDERTQLLKAKTGDRIKFSSGAELEFLQTSRGAVNDLNAASLVTQLQFGENKFLFTGDLPQAEEEKMLTANKFTDVSVLKVSHHGSRSATTEKFLQVTQPEVAILSVGQNNQYGHPHPETLERLEKSGAQILCTDQSGSIEFVCASAQAECFIVK